MGDMADYYDERHEEELMTREYPPGHRFAAPRRSNNWNQFTPKGKTMAERLTKAQIEHELRVNSELMTALRTRRNQLQKQHKKALPSEPPNYTMFTVAVRFKMRGQRYQFLILRSGNRYWTTGTRQDQQVFSSWETLCEWLEGPDVYDHSDLEILQSSGKVVSFTSGAIEQMDPAGEPPF